MASVKAIDEVRSEAISRVGTYPHGRVPRRVREEQILALAEQLFAERGYELASMDELAARAAISKPVIYSLIGKKEELYRRVFERAAAELAADVAAAAAAHEGDLEGILAATSRAFFEFIAEHRDAWTTLSTDPGGGPLAAHLDDLRANQNRLVAGLLLGTAAAAGADPDPQAIEAATAMLNGAYEMLARWWSAHPEVETATLARWMVEFAQPGLERLVRP